LPIKFMTEISVLVAGNGKSVGLPPRATCDDVKLMLNWFKGRDREVRWDVEVVGNRGTEQ